MSEPGSGQARSEADIEAEPEDAGAQAAWRRTMLRETVWHEVLTMLLLPVVALGVVGLGALLLIVVPLGWLLACNRLVHGAWHPAKL